MSGGDRIEVRQLRVLGHHGALVGEQDRAQPFEVDLDVYLDLHAAARADDLTKTADYGEIALQVAEVVTATRFELLESLAGAIADVVLADVRVQRVEVTVRKLHPPLPLQVETVGVHLSRGRGASHEA